MDGPRLMNDVIDDDDAKLLHNAVNNIGKLADSIDDIAAQLHSVGTDITIHIEYDDRIARALESIADTLSRLERSS